ncbi:MAG: CDP-glycerol glycerophosphotransferase family protein, partial [Clostridiales bacterium]|nr:CDP-glycerol glycerophosphotransferase family protein [Clostridiales bacterium]
MREREKRDYKKFKHVVNKHIVFYSEKSGFYKYYKDIINELLARSNLTIHYVTNDYNDAIFRVAETEPRIKPYYIGLKKLAILMMLVETDIFLMTTPDLNKFYLKRSYIKNDVEYIYVPHDSMSSHMGFREGAFDAFDTILCVGKHFYNEVRKTEETYKLKPKNLVEFGFPYLDELVEKGRQESANASPRKVKEILIAPSWQEDNLLDSCIDTLIEKLYGDEYRITVRPHPEYAKRYGYQLQNLVERYRDRDPAKLSFELDFSVNTSIYTADLMFTDWSGIAAEYCFATRRPAVFVNTQMKVCNENWQKIGITPVEIDLRNKLGVAVDKEQLADIGGIVKELFDNQARYAQAIDAYFEDFTFNHGTAAKKGADYILKSLLQKKKKQNKTAEKEE